MKLLYSSLIVIVLSILIYSNSAFKTSLSKALPFASSIFSKSSPLARLYSSLPTRKLSTMPFPRVIQKTYLAKEQAEGVGARVRRAIGVPQLRNFSPFLMLDHFTVHPGAGFPDHPHRGQETITYLIEGAFDHEDFTGSKGTLYAGDLQFMTAGRGIVHAEMPNQSSETNVGMQLWVDLPRELKKVEPRYRDLKGGEIPVVKLDDDKVTIKVISGKSHGVDSVRDLAYTPVHIYDLEIKPGGKVTQEVPADFNVFAYVLSGNVKFGAGQDGQVVEKFHNVVFEVGGNEVVMSVAESEKESARICEYFPQRTFCEVSKLTCEIDLVGGQILDQPVVQYGPFVLNTQREVQQAIMDYQTSSNGFERAANWESEIGKSMAH
jgi:redox-sensitive bicupin YhaK (pirin superfamily)